MKRIVLLCFCTILCVSCSSYGDLYKHTDYFVNQLSTKYESYGLQGLSEKEYTKDYKYSATPVGRLIIVKIEDYAPSKEYEGLRKALERHYRNDTRVNKVYINQGGTIVIDCRD